MKTLSALVLAAAIGLPLAAHAATGSYSASKLHYNIYSSGGFATMPFSVPSSVPRTGATVTSVNYTWSSYNNGNTSELVELCYSAQYSSTIGNCVNISSAQSGTTTAHAGLNAKGQFWIRHTITGGSYPAVSNSSDYVTVNYSY